MANLESLLDPVWVPLGDGLEATAWPLRLSDGALLLGISGAEAAEYAEALGGRLATSHEEDALVSRAAAGEGEVLRPITHWPPKNWPHPSAQSLLVLAQLQQRGGMDPTRILAGACKLWVGDRYLPGEKRSVRDDRAAIYGWHVPVSELQRGCWCGVAVWPCDLSEWRVIQGLSDFHRLEDRADGYATGVRVVRECHAV